LAQAARQPTVDTVAKSLCFLTYWHSFSKYSPVSRLDILPFQDGGSGNGERVVVLFRISAEFLVMLRHVRWNL